MVTSERGEAERGWLTRSLARKGNATASILSIWWARSSCDETLSESPTRSAEERRHGDLCPGAREQSLGRERDHPDGDRRHADLWVDRHHQFRPRRIPHAGRDRRLGSGWLRLRLHSGALISVAIVGLIGFLLERGLFQFTLTSSEQWFHGLARPFHRAPARRHPHLELVFEKHPRTASGRLADRRDPHSSRCGSWLWL